MANKTDDKNYLKTVPLFGETWLVLVKHELIESRQNNNVPSLQSFLEEYQRTLSFLSDNTRLYFRKIRRYFMDYYSSARKIDTITSSDALEHCTWLVSQRGDHGKGKNLGSVTIYQAIKSFRKCFNFGMERGYVSENPYAKVRMGEPKNKRNRKRVSMETIYRVLEACGGKAREEMQFIIILSRVAGLRIPSEINDMKFDDFHFSKTGQRYFTVSEKGKTRYRVVPMFSELIPYFEKVKANAKPGQKYVFEYYREHQSAPRGLERAIKRAGVESWPSNFNNLRSNAITDKREAGWEDRIMSSVFGNNAKVRDDYYIQDMSVENSLQYCLGDSAKNEDVHEENSPSDKIIETVIKNFSVDSSVIFYEIFSSMNASSRKFYVKVLEQSFKITIDFSYI